MCGIVAIYSRRRPISESTVRSALQRLHHRGPDAQNHWISQERHVALGHVRLSIIDLVTGDQPISNENGRTRIVVNGEFYGYEQIQRELQQSGHRLRTRSDSEIALHLYEDLGPQCLHRLRGEFAMVIWDETNQTLFAARDRFGIKPLFYAFHNDALYIASEAKALFAAGVPARWNMDSVWTSPDHGDHRIHTLFEGVFQVPPGHYLLTNEQHFQLIPYWDFNYPKISAGTRQRPDAEYAEELRHTLDEAVRVRLRADVPVGCYLSGGIDSSAILGLAAKHSIRPIRAFTLSFDHGAYNEEAEAREMAEKAGAQFFSIPIGPDDIADHFSDAIVHAEMFAINSHGVSKYLLSRAVRNAGCKVVLTGEGSDEIFGGYTSFRRDMLLFNNEGQDPAAVAAFLQKMEQTNGTTRGLFQHHGEHLSLDHVRRLLGFVPAWMDAFSAISAKFQSLFSGSCQAQFEHYTPYRALLAGIDVEAQLAGRAAMHQSMYLWSKSAFPKYLLSMLGDRMEMAHSIEGRVPFLDHHLVDLASALPVNVKMRGATDKFVLREAVRDVVTETIYRRQKHAFLTPPVTLNPRGRFHELVQDMLRGPMLAAVPFLDPKKVIAFLDQLPDLDEGARVAGDLVLMTVASACVLQDRFRLVA